MAAFPGPEDNKRYSAAPPRLPVCTPIGSCPQCGTITAHLLGSYFDCWDGRLINRECLTCGHTWHEVLWHPSMAG